MPDSPRFKYLCDVNRTLAMREREPDGSDRFALYPDAVEFLGRVPYEDVALFTNMSRPSSLIKLKLEEAGVPKELKLVSAGDVAIEYAKNLSHKEGYEGRVLGVGFPDFIKHAEAAGLKFVNPLANGGPETGILLVTFNDKHDLWEGSKLVEGANQHSKKTNSQIFVIYTDDESVFDNTIDGRKVCYLGTGAQVKPILDALKELGVYHNRVSVGKPSLEWTQQLVSDIGWEKEERIILVDDKMVPVARPIYKSVQIDRKDDGIEWKDKKKDSLIFKDLLEMLEKLPSRLT